jgi:hypothetical protein
MGLGSRWWGSLRRLRLVLTQERLKELFSYNADTGDFTRNVRVNNQKSGTVASSKCHYGYIKISIDGFRQGAHRLAFLYMTGKFPKTVDHINGDPSDNRWSNLRECTQQQNSCNKGPQVNNKLGIKNVYTTKIPGTYRVVVNSKSYGSFRDIELAELVAKEVCLKLYGEFVRG